MKRSKFVIKQHETDGGTRWWWNFVAPNGEIVVTSQMLKSERACRKGIRSVKRGWAARIVKA